MSPLGTSSIEPPLASRWARLEAWVAAGLVLGAVVGLGYHCRYLSVPIVDDAAISLAYGRTFFSGAGLRVTPFSQPVEGFSNPLWTLLLGLSLPLRLEPILFTHVLGIVFGVLALPAFALWGPAAEGRRLRLEDATAPIVAALTPTYAYWIASGMETGIETLLLGLSGAFVLRELRTGRSAHAGWALGLLCLTRPEGVLFAGASAFLWSLTRALRRQPPGKQELRICAWLVALVGGWLAVRWLYFADWLPNTYYAKRPWDFMAGRYIQNFWNTYTGMCSLAMVALGLGIVGGRALLRQTVLIALYIGCVVYFVLSAKGDWMREWRFLAPLVPLLGAAAGAGFTGLRNLNRRIEDRPGLWRSLNPESITRMAIALVAAFMLGALARSLVQNVERAPAVKAGPELPYEYIAGLFRETRVRTRTLGQLHPLLAYPDLGGQAMVMRNAEIIDVAGLADYTIAHLSGNTAAQEDYLISEGPPILMDVHGPSGYLGNFPKLMAQYHPIGGVIFMLNGLTATEDPRCPEGKDSTLAMGAQTLAGQFEREIQEDRAQEALHRWRCVRAYKDWKELPPREVLSKLAEQADARGDALVREGKLEPALRQYSLATLLDEGNAHRRRKTEKLRVRIFPPKGT